MAKKKSMQYDVNQDGYYGDFGGAFIPEMLYANVEELRQEYLGILADDGFKEEFKNLLKNYVGRPNRCSMLADSP